MKIEEICLATLNRLDAQQMPEAGPGHVRGEFPMVLRCPEPRADYNYLTGYALLHLACAHSLPAGHLSADARLRIQTILERAKDVPRAYQTARGTANWYHGRLTGDHLPPDFDWPDQILLSVYDDLDDTAVSVMLRGTHAAFTPLRPMHTSLFTRWGYDPRRDVLRPKALRRLQLAGVAEGVYLTWVIEPDGDERGHGRRRVQIPPQNSVELVTAANVCAALGMLAGADAALPGLTETRGFVNRLTLLALDKLTAEDDPSFLEFCAPYYPRVPFAPLAFLLRAHALSEATLLSDEVLTRIADAVLTVAPGRHSRPAPEADFAARAYWLNAAGWCARLGLLPAAWLAGRALPEFEGLAHRYSDAAGAWPDFVFFLAAHIGDYSGHAYSGAMMVETMSLLSAAADGAPHA